VHRCPFNILDAAGLKYFKGEINYFLSHCYGYCGFLIAFHEQFSPLSTNSNGTLQITVEKAILETKVEGNLNAKKRIDCKMS